MVVKSRGPEGKNAPKNLPSRAEAQPSCFCLYFKKLLLAAAPGSAQAPSLAFTSWRHSKVQSSRSVALVFCCHTNGHLFVPKVPEGRHVEGHVGKDHQVLKEGEERVDWDGRMGGQNEPDYTPPVNGQLATSADVTMLTSSFTELVVAPEEVHGGQTTADVKQKNPQFPTL